MSNMQHVRNLNSTKVTPKLSRVASDARSRYYSPRSKKIRTSQYIDEKHS
jgi:hypothetical protein